MHLVPSCPSSEFGPNDNEQRAEVCHSVPQKRLEDDPQASKLGLFHIPLTKIMSTLSPKHQFKLTLLVTYRESLSKSSIKRSTIWNHLQHTGPGPLRDIDGLFSFFLLLRLLPKSTGSNWVTKSPSTITLHVTEPLLFDWFFALFLPRSKTSRELQQ